MRQVVEILFIAAVFMMLSVTVSRLWLRATLIAAGVQPNGLFWGVPGYLEQLYWREMPNNFRSPNLDRRVRLSQYLNVGMLFTGLMLIGAVAVDRAALRPGSANPPGVKAFTNPEAVPERQD